MTKSEAFVIYSLAAAAVFISGYFVGLAQRELPYDHVCAPCPLEHHIDGDGCKSPQRTGVVR